MTGEPRTLYALGADLDVLDSLGPDGLLRELCVLWMTAWGGVTMVPILRLWIGCRKDEITRALRPLRESGDLSWYDSRTGTQRDHLGRRPGVMGISRSVALGVHARHPRLAHAPYHGLRESWRNDVATQWTAMRVIHALRTPVVRMLPHERQLSGFDAKHPDTIVETRDGFRIAIDAETTSKGYEAIASMNAGLISGLSQGQFDAAVVSLARHFPRSALMEYMAPFQSRQIYGLEAYVAARVTHIPLDLGVCFGERG